MKTKQKFAMPLGLLLMLALGLPRSAAAQSNIDPNESFAWSENAGWANFRPTDGGVTVIPTHLTGFAWTENAGWIKLGADGAGPYANTGLDDWGVNRDPSGALSGYAWSENAGWINFDPGHGQVTIDPQTGAFDGYAWAENLGWFHLRNASPAYGVRQLVADLSITKGDSPDPVIAGSSLTYSLAVTNNGPSDSSGGTVSDPLPAGLSFVSSVSGCTEAGGLVTCPLGPLAATASQVLSFVVAVDPAQTAAIDNTATVSGNETDPTPANSAMATTTVSAQADLSMIKSDSPDPVIAGSNLTYSLVVTNDGPSDSSGGTVSDPLPAGLSFVSSASGCTEADGTVTCPLGPLAATASQVLSFTVAVDPAQTAAIDNTATVSGNETDPTPANSAMATTTVSAEADLSITKTDGDTSAVPGQSVTYTIVASNAGPSDVASAMVTDAFPADLTCDWTSTAVGGAAGNSAGSGQLSDTLSLPVGSSVTYMAVCAVDAGATGMLANTAKISSAVSDPEVANDNATDEDTLDPVADLAISKMVDRGEAAAGESLLYTITAANQGPSAAPSAVVEDVFPMGLTCSWMSEAFGGATGNTLSGAGDLDEELSMPAASSVVYTAACDIALNISGTLRNTATIAAPDDPDASNDSAYATTEVEGIADLEIELFGPETAVPGNRLEATFTVVNRGLQDVVGAQMRAIFPFQLAAVTWECTATAGGSCTAGPVAGDIDDFFDLVDGDSATYKVAATVVPGATGSVDLEATVLVPLSLSDPDPLDNVARSSVELRPQADLAVRIDDKRDEIIAGKRLRYFVIVESSGPSDAPEVELTTTLGEGPHPLEGVSWTCTSAGTFCGTGTSVLDETFGLAAGAAREYRVIAQVPEDASSMVRSTADVVDATILETDTSDNSASDETLLVSGEIDELGEETVLDGARNPDVTVTSSGHAVVVYERDEEDGSVQVYRQVLNPLGKRVGGPDRISDGMLGAIEPAIAFNPSLGAALRNPEDAEAGLKVEDTEATLSVWPIPEVLNIKGKIGSQGRLFDVTSFSAETADRSPDCASLLAGEGDDFLAVWQRAPRSGGTPRILARPIDAFGPSEPELEVSSQGSQTKVAARTNRQFLVVWRVGGNIRAQRVKHDGQPVGSVINVSSTGDDSRPRVAYHRAECTPPCGANDRFLVVWQHEAAIRGRLYDKNLQPQQGPFLITEVLADEAVDLVGTAGGSFVVTLRSEELGRTRHQTIAPADGTVGSLAAPVLKGIAPAGETGSRLSVAPAPRGTIPDADDSLVLFAAWDRPSAEAQDILNQRFVLTGDLVLEITAMPESVFAGDMLTYTVSVANVSQTEARNVQVSQVLPPGSTFISSSGCAQDPNAAETCTLGTIAGNSVREYDLTTVLDTDLEELVLELTASASSSTADADATDNSASVLTPVGEADLEVTIAGPPGQVTAGATASFLVTVRNAGPSPAAAVVLSATLAAGTLAIASDGCAEDPEGIPTCSLGTLAVDEEREVELTVEIAGGAPATVAQTVTAAAATFDPDLGDNDATATVTVASPELAVVLEAPAAAVAGNPVTVTATVINHGEAAAAEVVLSWVLPPALTPLSSSGCEEDPQGAPRCTLGTLQADEVRRVDLEMEIGVGFSGMLTLAVNATSPSLNSVPTAMAETTVAAATVLPLLDGRFAVRVDWRTPPAAGAGRAVPFSGNTGFFWFFAADNTELVVKILDGRGFNDHFWFFYGALSDVEYDLTVTDLETGVERIYHNAAGNLCGQADTLAFPATGSEPAAPLLLDRVATTGVAGKNGACVPDAGSLCLADGRFRVEVDWRNQHAGGTEGAGTGIPGTADSGSFWFFDQDSVDLAVKVLDGRPVNGRFWFFYGGLSDVEYTITVTDTETGAARSYFNPPGEVCGGADVEAF